MSELKTILSEMIPSEKIDELFKDEPFVEKLATMETPEAVMELFKTKGVTLSLEQIQKLIESSKTLSEEDLTKVGGGLSVPAPVKSVWKKIKNNPGKSALAVGGGIIALAGLGYGGKKLIDARADGKTVTTTTTP